MNTPHINRLTNHVASSTHLVELLSHALRAVLIIVLSIAGAVLIDAGYALPGAGLLLLDLAIIAAAVWALRPLLRSMLRGQSDIRTAALYIEKRLDIKDNQLINAIDLASQNDPHTSASLRAEAIEQAEATAKDIAPDSIIDRRPVKEAFKPAAAVVVGLLIIYLLIPSIFHAVIPRLVLPLADLPPFTLVKFDVRIDPEPVYLGKPATIRANLSAPGELGPAHIVFVDDDVKSQPLPMYRTFAPDQTVQQEDTTYHYALRLERVETPRRFYITTQRGRSKLYTLTPDTSPLIERATITYDYPDYTNWPDAHYRLTSTGIRALTGSSITLHIESNTTLAGGSLELTSSTPTSNQTYQLTPDPNDPRIAAVTFPLQYSGEFKLALTGADNKPGVDTLQGKLTALPDRPPKIDILEPDRQAVVPEGWPIDATFVAGDDIAINQTTLHLGVNDQPTQPIDLELAFEKSSHTVARSAYTIQPHLFNARAGDTLKYYASAQDNHPDAPQSTESPVHAIHIITMQQYMDLARTQYRIDDLAAEYEVILDRLGDLEAQRDELLHELAELQNQLNAGEALTDEQQQAMQQLQQALTDYAEQSSELAEELNQRTDQSSLYEFEENYKQMLEQLADDLESQQQLAQALNDALEHLNSDSSQSRQSQMQELADEFALMSEPFSEETRQQTEYTQAELEKLRHADDLMQQGERIRRVALAQDELAVRLSSLAESNPLSPQDQARADKLAQEQAELRDELEDAAQALREAAEDASEALPRMSRGALDIADRIDNLGIVSTQSAAEKAATAGNGPLAHQAAREAADQLDSLLTDVDQAQMQASSDLDGCFNLPRQNMQSLLQQMAAGQRAPGSGLQGGSGYGMAGNMARLSMIGPQMPGQPNSDSESRRARNNARRAQGRSIDSDLDPDQYAEVINAEPSTIDNLQAVQLQTLPTQYREQAEAYFKRIAEEN